MRIFKYIILAALVLILAGCSFSGFQSQFDNAFAYNKLMQTAAFPNDGIPEFSWADHGSENSVTLTSGGGGGSTGGGGCPT